MGCIPPGVAAAAVGPCILPRGVVTTSSYALSPPNTAPTTHQHPSLPVSRSDFSLVDGHCFKALYLGKTNTLNYYQPINQTEAHNVGGPVRRRRGSL